MLLLAIGLKSPLPNAQGCSEKFSVVGEDGRETEISAEKYSIYAAPKFSEHWLDWNDDKTSRIW